MRVLVTGSSGFLGQALVKALASRSDVSAGYAVSRRYLAAPLLDDRWTCYCCDLTQADSVRDLLHATRPDVVFHLAGNPIVAPSSRNPGELSSQNVVATHNLLGFLNNGERFVLASSATVYGDRHGSLVESMIPRPTSYYGATKYAAETLVHAATNQGGIRGCSLRLVANVGPGATHGLLKDILTKLRSDSPTLDLLGNAPGSCKPFLHVSDTAAAFVHFGLDGCCSVREALNIAPADQLYVLEVANLVMARTGLHKPIRWLGAEANWAGDNPSVLVNNTLAMRFGWKPSYTSQEAIIKAIEETR